MTQATLKLHGAAPLEGTVETGGDYIRFRTEGGLSEEQAARLSEGVIEIDGRDERVVLESAHTHRAVPGIEGDRDGLELTLRRFEPSAS